MPHLVEQKHSSRGLLSQIIQYMTWTSCYSFTFILTLRDSPIMVKGAVLSSKSTRERKESTTQSNESKITIGCFISLQGNQKILPFMNDDDFALSSICTCSSNKNSCICTSSSNKILQESVPCGNFHGTLSDCTGHPQTIKSMLSTRARFHLDANWRRRTTNYPKETYMVM